MSIIKRRNLVLQKKEKPKKWKKLLIMIIGCYLINTVTVGSYIFYSAAKDWLNIKQEFYLQDMEIDQVIQLQKAVTSELKYRQGK